MKVRPVLFSLAVGVLAVLVVVVADLVAVSYWQPSWLVTCVTDTPPRSPRVAPKSDPQASISEELVSQTTCSDRFGVPASLAFGVLAGALSYRRSTRAK